MLSEEELWPLGNTMRLTSKEEVYCSEFRSLMALTGKEKGERNYKTGKSDCNTAIQQMSSGT